MTTTPMAYSGPALEAVYLKYDGSLRREPIIAFLWDEGLRENEDGDMVQTDVRMGWEAAVLGFWGILKTAREIDPDYIIEVVPAGVIPQSVETAKDRRKRLLDVAITGYARETPREHQDGEALLRVMLDVYAGLSEENHPPAGEHGLEVAGLEEIRSALRFMRSGWRGIATETVEEALEIVELDIADLSRVEA